MNFIEAIPIETPNPILKPIQAPPEPIVLDITPKLYYLFIERIKDNNKRGEENIVYKQTYFKRHIRIDFEVHFYEGLHYKGNYCIALTDKLREFNFSDARYINSIHINIITELNSKTFIFTKAMIGKCFVDDITNGGKITIIPNINHRYIRRNNNQIRRRPTEIDRPPIINGVIQPLF